MIRFLLGVDDALRAISPAAPASDPAAPRCRDKPAGPIAEFFRTWLDGRQGLDLGEHAASLGSRAGEFFAGAAVSARFCGWAFRGGNRGNEARQNRSWTYRHRGRLSNSPRAKGVPAPLPEIEDSNEFSLADTAALDVPPVATATEKRPVAVADLVAGLFLAGLWQVADTVRNAGRAREKVTRYCLILFSRVSLLTGDPAA